MAFSGVERWQIMRHCWGVKFNSDVSKPPAFLIPLMLVNLSAHMALSGGRVAGSIYALKSGASELVAGVLMGLYAFLPVLTALQVGRWVDRAGAFIAIRIGVLCVIVGAIAPAVWLSIPSLFVSACLVGFGFNVVSVALQNTVGRLNASADAQARLANFGWFAMSHSASSTIGPVLAGVLIDLYGYRASFAALAASALLAAIIVLKTRHAYPRPDPRQSAAEDEAPERVWSLLREPEMRRIYGVSVTLSVAWDIFIVLLPVLGTRLGFSASVIGTVFSLFALGTFAVRFATPWLSHRYREWTIMRAALAVIVVSLCALPFVRTPMLLMLVGFALGAALGSGQPNMLSLLHAAAPPGRSGEAVGLRSLLGNSSAVSVPVAFGAAVGLLGLMPILFAGAFLAAGGLRAAHQGVKSQ
jgi:predicted MFS family arabinose efflux permease